MDAATLSTNLAHFTGSESIYRHWMSKSAFMTEGCMYLAENGNCLWLFDIIVSHQSNPRVRREPFQAWKLVVNEDRSAVVSVTDGNRKKPILEQLVPFTDFMLKEITIWMEGSPGQMVMMLKTER